MEVILKQLDRAEKSYNVKFIYDSLVGNIALDSDKTPGHIMDEIIDNLNLIDGTITFTKRLFEVKGNTSLNKELYIHQIGEFDMYGGPYNPKMQKPTVTLGGIDILNVIKKVYSDYTGEKDEDEIDVSLVYAWCDWNNILISLDETKPLIIPPIELIGEPDHEFGFAKHDELFQKWWSRNTVKETMSYKVAADRQILFFRDDVSYMLKAKEICVVSTHTSKSIKLPVYKITLKDGIMLIIRDNFHDIKVSVISPYLINEPLFEKLNSSKENIDECYCEGFKEEWIFPIYKAMSDTTIKSNMCKFTIELHNKYDFYTFAWLLNNKLNENESEKIS